LDLAKAAQSSILSRGGEVLRSAFVGTVAGHPAASFEARIPIAGILERYLQTVVVASEWGRVYVITGAFPDAIWASHSEDYDWILEGFRIEAPPSVGPPWLVIAAGVGGATVAVASAVWFWNRRRRKGLEPPGAGEVPPAL